MNSIGPPYIWYTHNTTHRTNTNKTNTWSKPPLLPQPIDKLKNWKIIFKTVALKPCNFSDSSSFKARIIAVEFSVLQEIRQTTPFAEEIWSQLDANHLDLSISPSYEDQLSVLYNLWLWYVHWSHCQQPHWIEEARSACIFIQLMIYAASSYSIEKWKNPKSKSIKKWSTLLL
jgi:hypothetical protein